MARNFIILFLFALLVGCSSSKKFDERQSKKLSFNQSFASGFKPKLGESDVLVRESAARFSDSRLEELEDSKNPLAQVVAACIEGNVSKGFDILDQNYPLLKKKPDFWNQMGNCYFHKGELNKAILYYNKSREINSGYVPPLNNLGVIYQKRGEEQKALVAFKKALKLSSNALTPKFNLAQLYLKYGMINKALAMFSHLYKKNNADNDVINGMATCYLIKGQINKALSFFDRIDYEAVRYPTVALNYAIALKIKGQLKRAKRVFSKMNGPKTPKLREYKERVERFIEDSL